MEKYIECTNCKEEFGYRIVEENGYGNKTQEEINCPYCGNVHRHLMTSGLVRAFKA